MPENLKARIFRKLVADASVADEPLACAIVALVGRVAALRSNARLSTNEERLALDVADEVVRLLVS